MTLVVVGLLTACGVPSDGPVRTVDPEQVPYRLLEGSPTGDTAVRDDPVVGGPGVFFTDDDRLVRIGLNVGSQERLDRLNEALVALSMGPVRAEQQRGLGSAIPAGLRLVAVGLSDGRAEIDLLGDAASPDVGQNALAAGQIVLTATSVAGVDSVVLVRAGQRVAPALPDGELANGPVTSSDYAALLKGRAGSPTGSAMAPLAWSPRVA